jgi:hypothetical protein
MKTMIKKLFALLLVLSFASKTNFVKAQGLNFAFGSGTELFRLELGYSINDKIHAGVQYTPGLSFVNSPSFLAGWFRKSFEEKDGGNSFFHFSSRAYVGATIGILKLAGKTDYDMFTGTTTKTDPINKIGFSGNAGAEFLYGKSKNLGYYFELNVGQVPNFFNSVFSTLEDDLNTGQTNVKKEQKIASFWGISTGIRYYFNK